MAARAGGRVVKIERLAAAQIPLRAAALIADDLRKAIAQQGYARLAVPGGSAQTPIKELRLTLGKEWQAVRLTWVDERCVDFWSPDSNRGEAFRADALDASDPPQEELPLWIDDDTTDSAIARVQAALEQEFGGQLDVALLGMGPDGHIASLFPGHTLLLEQSEHWVQTLCDSPKPPEQRMTLSLAFLKKTRQSYLVALGESKRTALLRVVNQDLALPASHLPNLTILSDLDLGETP